MAKYVYPAIFTPEADGGYFIYFPDIKNCFTQENDLASGIEMAEDVLALMLWQHEENGTKILPPTPIKALSLEGDAFATLISVDTIAYRKRFSKTAVKKTLTIPGWLDEMAKQEHLNFSNVLQEALAEKLHISL
ncbi:MAG: type II toxin-antitoxin system HicB family antitoxin [Eubacterium sp.]